MMKDPIYKIKNININKLDKISPLDNWFYQLIVKSEDELNILDISRMLRQKIYPDIAISKAWNILHCNPFAGEMYDGQLLELLCEYLQQHPGEKNYIDYYLFMKRLAEKGFTYFYDDLQGEREYRKILKKVKALFEKKNNCDFFKNSEE